MPLWIDEYSHNPFDANVPDIFNPVVATIEYNAGRITNINTPKKTDSAPVMDLNTFFGGNDTPPPAPVVDAGDLGANAGTGGGLWIDTHTTNPFKDWERGEYRPPQKHPKNNGDIIQNIKDVMGIGDIGAGVIPDLIQPAKDAAGVDNWKLPDFPKFPKIDFPKFPNLDDFFKKLGTGAVIATVIVGGLIVGGLYLAHKTGADKKAAGAAAKYGPAVVKAIK